MHRVYTHVRPDLDALLSVWFYIEFILGSEQIHYQDVGIHFVPAYWDGSADPEAGIPAFDPTYGYEVALDIDVKGRGLKGKRLADGTVMSCFASLQEANRSRLSEETLKALQPLTLFAELQDTTGSAVRSLVTRLGGKPEGQDFAALAVCSLNSVLHAYTALKYTDEQILKAMSVIFDGMYENALSRIRAEDEADKAEVLDGKVAVVKDSKEFATSSVLFERGVLYVVFLDGNNMGIARRHGETVPCLNNFTKAVVEASGEGFQEDNGEWFGHSAGFLLARGTRKAPMQTPSRVDPKELARAMLRAIT